MPLYTFQNRVTYVAFDFGDKRKHIDLPLLIITKRLNLHGQPFCLSHLIGICLHSCFRSIYVAAGLYHCSLYRKTRTVILIGIIPVQIT